MIKFKHVLFLFFTVLFIFCGISSVQAQNSAAETKAESEESAFLQIPLYFSYSSVYWWRGFVLNNEAGIFWPGLGLAIGDTGVEIRAIAGISEHWVTKEDDFSDTAKSCTEYDYGISYSKEFDSLSIGASLLYIQYPFFDEVDPEAIDPSFLEASVSLGVDTILSPSIEFYYDYFSEDRIGSDAKKVPTTEDYYAKLSVSHDIISTEDGFTFSARAWIGYYNDPYFEASGWSDAVISLGFAKDYNNLSAVSNLYYGRTIGKDFQNANEAAGVTVKNHFWCDFGLTYTL